MVDLLILLTVCPGTLIKMTRDYKELLSSLHRQGDSHGRGSFDTSTRFVAGDAGAKFGATAPLEYETTGETGHPHWELIFEYILRQCGYLVEFNTVYVIQCMSWWITAIWQTTNGKIPPCLTGLQLQDGGIVVSSSLGLIRRKLSFSYSPSLQLPGCIMYTLLGQAPLSWLPWWQCSLDSILYCLIAIVYPSPCLKLKICGQRPFWPDFQRIQKAHPLLAFPRFRTDPQVEYTQHRVCNTRMGQGARVVTEPHSELNAGLIVIFRSSHPPLFDWNCAPPTSMLWTTILTLLPCRLPQSDEVVVRVRRYINLRNANASRDPDGASMSRATKIALHEAEEARAAHKLKGHCELLEAYMWHRISAERQRTTTAKLLKDLSSTEAMLHFDFKENVRYPMSREETGDEWHAQNKLSLTVFGCAVHAPGRKNTHFLLVSEILDHDSQAAHLLLTQVLDTVQTKAYEWSKVKTLHLVCDCGPHFRSRKGYVETQSRRTLDQHIEIITSCSNLS